MKIFPAKTYSLLTGALLLVVLSPSPGAEPIKEGTAEVNGTKLYYEVAGKGFPLVLVSGGGTLDRRAWDDQFEAFAKSYRVIRYVPGQPRPLRRRLPPRHALAADSPSRGRAALRDSSARARPRGRERSPGLQGDNGQAGGGHQRRHKTGNSRRDPPDSHGQAAGVQPGRA